MGMRSSDEIAELPDISSLPTLSEVHTARLSGAWLRYAGGALIVGGSTVALTLLLAGAVVQPQVFMVLDSLYGILLCSISVFAWFTIFKPRPSKASLANAFTPGLIIGFYCHINRNGGRPIIF
jgi:hypothetical protein